MAISSCFGGGGVPCSTPPLALPSLHFAIQRYQYKGKCHAMTKKPAAAAAQNH
jgi:hypothetical protein